MSARLENLVFQNTTRCHSVFSCFSPALSFHWRLVAIDNVATRDPLEVLRTSGSAPRFPTKMALFILRLTDTSRVRRGSAVNQRIFLGIPVVSRPLTDRPESRAEIQRLRRTVGLANLEEDFLHATLAEVRQ